MGCKRKLMRFLRFVPLIGRILDFRGPREHIEVGLPVVWQCGPLRIISFTIPWTDHMYHLCKPARRNIDVSWGKYAIFTVNIRIKSKGDECSLVGGLRCKCKKYEGRDPF